MTPERFAAEATGVQRQVTRVVYLVSGDLALAEEAAAEALLRAWQRTGREGMPDSLGAWCTTVGLNWCRTQLRRRGAEERAVARMASQRAPDRPATDSLSEEVRAAVLALPLRQREVVVLHYLLDQDVATIAEVADISPGAVKNALFHARKSLARRLAPAADPATTATEERS